MLFLVGLGESDAFFAEVFLHGRVHRELFADGMSCHDPCELVSPPYFRAVIFGIPDVFGVDVEGVMVRADCV